LLTETFFCEKQVRVHSGRYCKWETRIPYPVFEVNLFIENRTFAFSCLAALINYSATFAVAFLLSLYLQYIKGLTPQGAGVVLIAQPIVMAVFSPLAGKLSDKIEPRMIASLGMGLTTLGLILLALVIALFIGRVPITPDLYPFHRASSSKNRSTIFK
jgi:Na+/melibiose symporter-like transporter